jgi:hypothetical protein
MMLSGCYAQFLQQIPKLCRPGIFRALDDVVSRPGEPHLPARASRREKTGFSLESLKHVDAYLEVLHGKPPQGEDEIVRVVLRCGAYVGEVIRKNSPDKMHWVAFKEAARYSAFAKGLGHSAGTAGILWRDPENMCFPLAKVCKFLENGSEDSVYSFARVILEGHISFGTETGPL